MRPQNIKQTPTLNDQKTSNLNQSYMSGFSHILYSEKRKYFQRIKYKNLDRYRKANWNEKADIITKIFFYIISNIINILNLIVFIYQTYMIEINQTYMTLSNIDLSCSLYFLVEYIAIIYIYRSHILKFIFSFHSLIDILSIIPTIVYFFIDNATFRSVFRIVKVFRVLRIYKSVKSLDYENNETNFLVFLSHFQIELIGTILVFFSFFFISSGIILSIQELVENAFNIKDMNFFDAFYYMLITTSTLGYGDIYPTHIVSRLFIILVIIGFISVVSYQIGKFVRLLRLWSNFIKFSFQNHIILICNSSINIFYILKELKRADHRQIILIITKDIEKLPSNEFPYNEVYILVTQEMDLEIFERANVKNAKSILIYSNLEFSQYEQIEKVNEFTLMKINEYYNLIPTYIQVIYSERKFYHSLDMHKSMLFKQNVTKLNSLALSEGSLKISKLIPILRVKNIILSKATFNPGYATFAQNLIFNNIQISENLEDYDMPTQAYFLGCENKIVTRKFPKYFIGKDFFEVVRLIYSKSITNYLTEIPLKNNTEINRPILLIGIVDSQRSNFFSENKLIKLYPRNFRIMSMTPGVFISYDDNHYVDKVLESFNQENNNNNDDLGLEIDNDQQQFEESYFKTDIKSMRRQSFCVRNSNYDCRSTDVNIHKNIYSPISKKNRIEGEYSIKKISTKSLFLKNKTHFVTNKEKYNDSTTKNNVMLLQSFNETNLFFIESELIQKIKKRYDPNFVLKDSEYFYENRILFISKQSYANLLNKHILVIGYQDGLVKLLKILFFHFPTKQICIYYSEQSSNSTVANETQIKLLKQFSNLYVLIGQIDNPLHLINANASDAFYVILLIDSIHEKVKEDTLKILSLKTFDHFFNHNSIIEILNPNSLKFFGYNIANKSKSLRTNEFLHPMFMNGRVLFLNQFNRLLSMSSLGDDLIVDAWLELISIGLKCPINPGLRRRENNIPITITLDIPDIYNEKEYHNLAADLLCLKTPVLILGIYVTQPIEYMKLRSEGAIKQSNHDKDKINIITSHKMYNVDELVNTNKYIKTLRKLKQLSYNDNIYLDSIDIKHPFTPIFITNPPPWFILSKGTKMLLLYNYTSQAKKKHQVSQQILIKQMNEKYECVIAERNERTILDQKQEYVRGIMSNLQKKFEEQFALSYKNLEVKYKKNQKNNI